MNTSPTPRTRIPIGQSAINASDLNGLRRAWRQRQLVIFLGAGVSIPYGIPAWKELVLELLFEQTEHTRRLGSKWPHYQRALASWMTEYFEYSPLVLARMVERDIRKRSRGENGVGEKTFLDGLRAKLYARCRAPNGRTTLQAIADLIAKNPDHTRGVVSFNFDDLLEQELKARKVPTISVSSNERMHSSAFRITHPHGFVPRKGVATRETLVFTEDDYHELTESVFHWALSDIVMQLRQATVLFVGLSMSDPSLRRLLDACRNSKIPPHWQIQRRHQVRDHERLAVIQDVANRARHWGGILGYPETSTPVELDAAVTAALQQADTYDREVFESMGVKTIWVETYDDIPALIDAIGHR